jgi:hypothetical protein
MFGGASGSMSEIIPTAEAKKSAKHEKASKWLFLTLIPIFGSISLGLVALFWYGVGAAGFFWAIACLAAGSLLGIVFGIPREAADNPSTAASRPATWLRANTNMEEISDWLTKLLVGAGLVELKALPQALGSAARYVAPSLTPLSRTPAAMESIAASIIIFFVVEGFIGGYLNTRVFFQIAFLKSDEVLREAAAEQDNS